MTTHYLIDAELLDELIGKWKDSHAIGSSETRAALASVVDKSKKLDLSEQGALEELNVVIEVKESADTQLFWEIQRETDMKICLERISRITGEYLKSKLNKSNGR